MTIDYCNIRDIFEKCNLKLKSNKKQPKDYINLILLYWDVSFDYGLETYCLNNNIFSEDEIATFIDKRVNLQEEASNYYPENKEVLFWKMFIEEHITYSPCLYKEEITSLQHEDFLLPIFYLKIQQCNTDEFNNSSIQELKNKIMAMENDYTKAYLLSYMESIH